MRIQSSARGWLVRRSPELSWAKSLKGMRGRRAMAAAWAAHRARVASSFGIQQEVSTSQSNRLRDHADLYLLFNHHLNYGPAHSVTYGSFL